MTKQPRPRRLKSQTLEVPTPCGNVYVTMSWDEKQDRPQEVFARLGKSGGCGASVVAALTTTLSIGLRSGADPEDLMKGLVGHSCHRPPAWDENEMVKSCADAIGRAMREFLREKRGI